MKFVLEQLIVNGVKYSKDKGKELIIRAYDEENAVKLSVIDKGVGISKKILKEFLIRFYRGKWT